MKMFFAIATLILCFSGTAKAQASFDASKLIYAACVQRTHYSTVAICMNQGMDLVPKLQGIQKLCWSPGTTYNSVYGCFINSLSETVAPVDYKTAVKIAVDACWVSGADYRYVYQCYLDAIKFINSDQLNRVLRACTSVRYPSEGALCMQRGLNEVYSK